MTLPSQFSLEEENFYKDIQDLVKKGSQNEKELSMFLERYMDLLARADLDEETFIINFTKAGLIIEASAKVYGTKVDRLWINLEHVLESLKNKGHVQSKKKSDSEDLDGGDDTDMDGACDEAQEGKRKLPHSGRRRKKVGDAFFSADDFIEIDNSIATLGKNMKETSNSAEGKIKLCEKVPNMFIKNKTKKKKMDVCLNKCLEDKDVIRLRDWVISGECLLVKEIYTPLPDSTIFVANAIDEDEMKDALYDSECKNDDNGGAFENMEVAPVEESIMRMSSFKDEKNNNSNNNNNNNIENENEGGVSLNENLKDISDKNVSSPRKDNLIDDLNISKESDLAKFPDVINRLSGDCLVDVDEIFWNSSKFQDVIPSKKMRAGKTNKLPCQLCADKKEHKKKGRRCFEEKKIDCLDTFFTPHVQPTMSEPHFGILPDEELYSIFKTEMKLIEQLGKVDNCKNINEAYHPNENPEEIRNFLGFDGFENYLMKRRSEFPEEEEESILLDRCGDDNDNFVDEPLPDKEFELPFPVTETTLKTNLVVEDNNPESKSDDFLANSESEYQKIVIEGLKDHNAAKSSFAKNKELGMKISKWHQMIADKIKLSQKRGALNMNHLAEKIMQAFPPSTNGDVTSKITFQDLVTKKSQRDIPRYFFACLQLTNEGNLDISKSNSKSLTTDCMIITRLRMTRTNYELDECTVKSPSKELSPSKSSSFAQMKRKRNSLSNSLSVLESKDYCKKKKLKQKMSKSHKRPKNFNSVSDSKRRRCSVSSADSLLSE